MIYEEKYIFGHSDQKYIFGHLPRGPKLKIFTFSPFLEKKNFADPYSREGSELPTKVDLLD